MHNIDLSKLHIYSYGIVADDNKDNEKIIKVFPIEKLFTEGGKIDDTPIEAEITSIYVEDKKDISFKTKKENINMTKANYLYATWLNANNSNRITPPNVYKKEKVIIYRFSNKNEYYWDTIDTDLNLRRDEHVVYEYRTDKKDKETIDDSYHLTISPKNKLIHLHLSDSNGELTTYDLSIDTKNGLLKIIDGKENYIELDSKADTLSAKINKVINIETETLNIKTKAMNIDTETLDIKSKDSTNIESGKTDIKSKGATKLDSGSKTEIKASGMSVKSGKLDHNGINVGDSHMHVSNGKGKPTTPPQ